MEIVGDDESDPIAIKSVSEASQIVHHLMRFSQQHGNEELDQSLMTVTKKLQDIQITNRRQQNVTDYFYK